MTQEQFDPVGRLSHIDEVVTDLMAEVAIPMLRIALGLTYIWFGALKILGVSPVADLVANTLFFIPKKIVVPIMGLWEVTIGLGLLFRAALRVTLILFVLQLLGTFMVFVTQPRSAFQKGNPLRLTKDGEFIIKNLVLLSAGIAVGSTVRRKDEDIQH